MNTARTQLFLLTTALTLTACAGPSAPNPTDSAPPPPTYDSLPLTTPEPILFSQADPVDAVRDRFEQDLSGPRVPAALPAFAELPVGPPLDDDRTGTIVGWNLMTGEHVERPTVGPDAPVPPQPEPDLPELTPDMAAAPLLRTQGGSLLNLTPAILHRSQRVRYTYALRGTGETTHCSGTLIDTQWLLTAAHCVYKREQGNASNNGYVKAIKVQPGYHNGRESRAGTAYGTQILVRSGGATAVIGGTTSPG